MWYYTPNRAQYPFLSSAASAAWTLLCGPHAMQPRPSTSSEISSVRPASWRGWKRRSWIQRLSGLMFNPSMRAAFEGSLTSWSAAPPVRISRWQEQAQDSAGSRAGSGSRCFESSTSVMHPGSSGRTSEVQSSEPSQPLSRNLAAEASELQRALSKLGLSVPLTGGSDSSCWPTATATDAKASGAAGYSTASGRHSGTTLTDAAVRLWPTPSAARYGSNRGGGAGRVGPTRPSLDSIARGPLGGTPRPGVTTTVLNPEFVETLMGFPIGWTDCALSETQ